MAADASMHSSREYEREAVASRDRLASSLRLLSDRLTPGQVMDEMLNYAKGGGGTFVNALSNAARDNPVPSLLIGAGLLMFLSEKTGIASMMRGNGDAHSQVQRNGTSRSAYDGDDDYGHVYDTDRRAMGNGNGHSLRDAVGGIAQAGAGAAQSVAGGMRSAADRAAAGARGAAAGARGAAAEIGATVAGVTDRARGVAAGVGATVAGAADSARTAASGLGGSVYGTADHLLHRAQDIGGAVGDASAGFAGQAAGAARAVPRRVGGGAMQARDNIMAMMGEQPLVAGALGLAIGAIIAAALPKTETEDQLMGEASDTLKHAVGEVAIEEMDAARAVAGKLAAEATDLASNVAAEVTAGIGKAAERQGVTPEGVAGAVHVATDKLSKAAGLSSASTPAATPVTNNAPNTSTTSTNTNNANTTNRK